jgi:nitrogen fixation protein FixH
MADDRTALTPSNGRRWPLLVAGLLIAQVGLGAATAYIAVRDPAHSVTPGYHAKALAWEEQARRQAASDSLGWTAGAEFTANKLHVRLVDRDGLPVRGAAVEAMVFHHARGKEAVKLDLQADSAGVYSAPFHAERAGTWEVRLTARRGGDEFLWTEARDHSAEIVR